MDDLKPPTDPARAVAAMFGKLDESDKDTFNWLIGLARYQPRADAKPDAPAPMGDAAPDDATVNERAISIVRRLARVGGVAFPVGIVFDSGANKIFKL